MENTPDFASIAKARHRCGFLCRGGYRAVAGARACGKIKDRRETGDALKFQQVLADDLRRAG